MTKTNKERPTDPRPPEPEPRCWHCGAPVPHGGRAIWQAQTWHLAYNQCPKCKTGKRT